MHFQVGTLLCLQYCCFYRLTDFKTSVEREIFIKMVTFRRCLAEGVVL